MGIKEQIIFPEMITTKLIIKRHGHCITTSATKDSDAKELLESFNFPLEVKMARKSIIEREKKK